jgi:alkylated DNA repair dioxygenase AlkB
MEELEARLKNLKKKKNQNSTPRYSRKYHQTSEQEMTPMDRLFQKMEGKAKFPNSSGEVAVTLTERHLKTNPGYHPSFL